MKNGISLIVLVITVAIISIITNVIIISLDKNDTIQESADATFLEDISNLREELNITIGVKILDKEIKNRNEVNATTLPEIQEYIPDFPEKYAGKFVIDNGELLVVESKLSPLEKLAIKKEK